MGALSAAACWAAEDDVLLKGAVEAGASLESLAKGAVCFSHKFTFQELQDRWHSLLYDSEISAQASARIVEYETLLSTSKSAKDIKHFNSKAKFFSSRKRKIDSVKSLFYAMRKRVCHEPCLPADFGYVITPCSCSPVISGCVCGGLLKHSEGYHLNRKVYLEESFVDNCGHISGSSAGRQDLHSKENGHYIFHTKHTNSFGSMVIDGNTYDRSLCGCSDASQLYFDGCDYIHKNAESSERNIACITNISDRQDYVHAQQPLLGDQYDKGVTGSKTLLDTDHYGVGNNQFSGDKGRLQELGSIKATGEQRCSWPRSSPTWSKFEAAKSPDTDMHIKDQDLLRFSSVRKMKTTKSDELELQANIGIAASGPGLDNALISGSGFMDSSSMEFSHKEDFEPLNGKNLLGHTLHTNQEDKCHPHAKIIGLDVSRVHHLDFSDTSSPHSNHIDPIPMEHNEADFSGAGMGPTSSEVPFSVCCNSIGCSLNTEDSEIPCNDDMFSIPGQHPLKCISTFDQNSQRNMCLISTKSPSSHNAGDYNHTDLVEDVQLSSPPKENMVAHNESCIAGSKPPIIHDDLGANNANMCMLTFQSVADFVEETTCSLVRHAGLSNLQNLTLGATQVPNQMNSMFLVGNLQIGCETTVLKFISPHSSASPDMEFHNPIATMSTSGQAEGSDDENSIPNIFDVESMIFDDEDLIPWGQESDFIQPEVSWFQHIENRKDFVRLEQSACSGMNRSIMSKGAFALLYGQHLKYYMKDSEVILGRETGEVHVDIDLGKEGKANKISRRQAVITMDGGGSFHIRNIGKCPMFLNSKEVPCNKRINLISDALLELRGMKFIFYVNPDAVRQHILRTLRGSSQGETTTFDWYQNP